MRAARSLSRISSWHSLSAHSPWLLEVAHVLEVHAVAGALAAGLVVTPVDRKAGALQHVEQAFLVLRGVGVVVLAGHAGEHAGHGNRCLGAARGDVAECHQAVFLRQLRRGIAVVAKQAEVFRPGALTHYKYGERLALVAGPGGRQGRVLADLAERLGGTADFFPHVVHRSADVVARHHHQAQFVVVTEQRGQALIVEHRHRGQQDQAGKADPQLAQQLPGQTTEVDRRLEKNISGHHAQQDDINQ